jgi:serine/threonine protein kinase
MADVGLVIKSRFVCIAQYCSDLKRLLKVIGKGGWGVVYKGMDEWTAGTVAVKQVKTQGIPPDELRGMMVQYNTNSPSLLKNEITLLQKLKNDNIVRYIDSHIAENAFYIVLEYERVCLSLIVC